MKPKYLLPTLILLMFYTGQSRAAEGGGSHYLQGTYGDFGMAMTGPPGFYVRNDLIWLDASIGPTSRGNFILSEVEQTARINALKLNYTSDFKILGGRFGAIFGVPIVLDVSASGLLTSPLATSKSGSESGISDPFLGGFLSWTLAEEHHLLAALTVYSDWGSYDADQIINLGRNYWSFNPTLAYTWLDPDRGHEISLTAGLMFNTENHATDYETGTEFHLDFMVAQHLPGNLALGINGYFYDQITDDEGPLVGGVPVGGDGFQSRGYGLGPAISWRPTIANRQVTFTAKWLHDFEARNRLESDVAMISVALKL